MGSSGGAGWASVVLTDAEPLSDDENGQLGEDPITKVLIAVSTVQYM